MGCVANRRQGGKSKKKRETKAKVAIQTGSKSVLVPLTNSLYVSGELTSTDTVLVDVGTGFMIEKVAIPVFYHPDSKDGNLTISRN